MNVAQIMLPEIILMTCACALFLVGTFRQTGARRLAAMGAISALAVVFVMQLSTITGEGPRRTLGDASGALRVSHFAQYVKMLAAGVGMLFVLLSWPSAREARGNSGVEYGADAGEFFALLLLSIAGIFVVASANDLIVLFLGIELASIPTYIMVSISRPVPAAQEAGVKYFFLGAMSAALLLFGLSYLYGTTGTTNMLSIARMCAASHAPGQPVVLSAWQMLAVVMVIAGIAFKIAAVPLHFYAGDVYQGAATSVTALLSFVPKTSGFVGLIRILYMIGGGESFAAPHEIAKLIWVMAALTMTVGNVLGLLQVNVKRVLAYSSVAHSGYMLVGVAALVSGASDPAVRIDALRGVLFYLAAYGIMNAGAFGVLMLLPAIPTDRPHPPSPSVSAETFRDIAGQGRRHVWVGLAMAVCCFSLIGLPLTVGFFGKVYLILPALRAQQYWLVVITMINAAISAAYYMRIVATMFLEPPHSDAGEAVEADPHLTALLPSTAVLIAVSISAAGTLLFGTVFPATELLNTQAATAAVIDEPLIPLAGLPHGSEATQASARPGVAGGPSFSSK
ncbi:MAG: NADH-quinone oxidoreductase subunit N [Tepidisphaeraceae bacterium]